MSFDSYRDWLQSHWGLSLQMVNAEEEPAYDPRMKPANPLERLGLEEPARNDHIQADYSTATFISAMRREKERYPQSSVWEIGSGSGMLSVEAGRLGAKQICASDSDDDAVELTRINGEAQGLSIHTVKADLFQGVPWEGPFDFILAILPQKPCPPGTLPLANDGGPEGTRLLLPLIEEVPSWLKPSGELMLFLHTLAHPEALVLLDQKYEAEVLSIRKRVFDAGDYPEILGSWKERRDRNVCYFEDREDGRMEFTTMIIKARPER